jgi:predicted CopG family antitoxin
LIKKKNIAISEPNYVALKRLGGVGDSFDDVVGEMLHFMQHHDAKVITMKHNGSIVSGLRDSEGESKHES